MMSVSDAAEEVAKVEATASDVSELSAALNAHGIDMGSNMQITSCQFALLVFLQTTKLHAYVYLWPVFRYLSLTNYQRCPVTAVVPNDDRC